MKLLRVRTDSGYRMLKKGFEIDFLTKTRVDKDMPNEDLIELEEGLYYPIETVFIGKNSSGKSTTLTLIAMAIELITFGRLRNNYLVDQDVLNIDILFYSDGYIYNYTGIFKKDIFANSYFLTIENESLLRTTYKKSYKKDLSNIFFPKENVFEPNIGSDTSCLAKLHIRDTSSLTDAIGRSPSNFATIIEILKNNHNPEIFNTLVRLFDDSIEKIDVAKKEDNNVSFKFKRVNQKEMNVEYQYIISRLSSGTFRGINIFAASLIAFKNGGHILIDEIEKSFNKNLVQNLLALFNDKDINKAGASLIYTTHYSELLDESDRCDNINVLHRVEDVISISNMCTKYEVRTDISKSNQFDQNAFDNFLNYDQLMALRRLLYK